LLHASAAASVSAAVACPHHCHCWLPTSFATAAIVATIAAESAAAAIAAREIFLQEDVQNITY
jgi:hypothetical protein